MRWIATRFHCFFLRRACPLGKGALLRLWIHDEDAFQHQMVSSLAALEVTRILGNLHVGLSKNEDNAAEDRAPELDDEAPSGLGEVARPSDHPWDPDPVCQEAGTCFCPVPWK